eukprot:9502789-Pyramimonas_sp.AAC.1
MTSSRDEFRALQAVQKLMVKERKRESLADDRAYMERLVAFKGCVTVYGWAAEQAKDCRQEAQHARAVLTVEDVSDL